MRIRCRMLRKNKSGFQPSPGFIGRFTQAVGLGWYEAGPLALRTMRKVE